MQLWIPRSALSLPLVLTMLTCTVLFYTSRAPRARLVKQGQLENKECEGHRSVTCHCGVTSSQPLPLGVSSTKTVGIWVFLGVLWPCCPSCHGIHTSQGVRCLQSIPQTLQHLLPLGFGVVLPTCADSLFSSHTGSPWPGWHTRDQRRAGCPWTQGNPSAASQTLAQLYSC